MIKSDNLPDIHPDLASMVDGEVSKNAIYNVLINILYELQVQSRQLGKLTAFTMDGTRY